MARIPEDEVERLKAEVSVQRLAEARGVELARRGRDLVGQCPFHDDHTPSLVISPERNLWHCLGACQAGGSCIDWVMRERGVSFRHAVELLRADLPPSAADSRPVRVSTVRVLPSPVEPDAADHELLEQVVEYYHQTLLDSPEALAYLERRGLRSSEAVTRFRLGFANRTLGLRLPLANRRAGAEIRERLQRLGVLRESGHEHFNGSLVVPVVDTDGHIVEMYGRKITPSLRVGTPLHLYLPGQHRGVWNVEALAVSDEVIVTEALLDALTLWVHGIRNVTAAYGVEGFTAEHLEAFRRHGVKRALIAYDRDPAGDRAAVQLAVRLVGAGIDAYRVQLPQGQDVNSYAGEELETAAERLAQRLRAAVWLGTGAPSGVCEGLATDAVDLPAGIVRGTAAKGARPTPAASTRPPVQSPPPDPSSAADPPPPAPPPALSEPTADPLLPTSPVAQPPVEVPAEVSDEGEVTLQLGGDGGRRWRVRGLARVTSFDALRVNVLVSCGGAIPTLAGGTAAFHVDTLDLYSARQRALFTGQAAAELGVSEEVIRRELGAVLLRCEGVAEELRRRATEPRDTAVAISDAEAAPALELLSDPRLLERILEDLDRCGVVGEETTKLVAYLAATSRLLDTPLACILQSTSAAGKSALLEAVLGLLPEEARVQYSALTGQALYYMADGDLAHKVLAIVEEEGAERAAYALKLLQSEGELRIASTGKEPSTGRLVTHEYTVRGPVAILLTTTAIDVDEELLNRCLVLTVDEERAQTRAIHERQRQAQTLAGLLAGRDRERVTALHRTAQRLLRPIAVVNPHAQSLTFADTATRTRRDHAKYLTLIRAVTLLFQHQRELRVVEHSGERLEYIEVTPDDIAVANRLADTVLGRCLDELPPQTRRLLLLVDELVGERCSEHGLERGDVRLSRREVRAATAWGDTQLKVHLSRLVELEWLGVHRAARGQGLVYELLWDGRGADGAPRLSGLLDPAALRSDQADHAYDMLRSGSRAVRSGLAARRSAPGRPLVGARSAPGRGVMSRASSSPANGDRPVNAADPPERTSGPPPPLSVVGARRTNIEEAPPAVAEATGR